MMTLGPIGFMQPWILLALAALESAGVQRGDRIEHASVAPPELVKQLADGGFITGPVGHGGVQELVVCEKKGDKLIERTICGVRFVRLIGKYGFEE